MEKLEAPGSVCGWGFIRQPHFPCRTSDTDAFPSGAHYRSCSALQISHCQLGVPEAPPQPSTMHACWGWTWHVELEHARAVVRELWLQHTHTHTHAFTLRSSLR